ncbi:MAG TPA: 2-dehydropantoate 2-reductase [Gemmatimonadaceae bacterium]|jgi:2-dehydropantoate 2-reductase
MRILVIGAGAVGGYFGGRLLQAGRDVTFLVRARRAAQLAEHGLVIRSRYGDFHRDNPPTVQANALNSPYDLVLLSCKAYDLDGAIESFAPAVGPHTAILPLLNGMRHLDVLDARFGADAVLGGLCMIASTLGENGEILHLNDNHSVLFGERNGASSTPIATIAAEMVGAGFESAASDAIVQRMWEKWVFIATGAGITSLLRGSVGDIEAAGGAPLAAALLAECAAIATKAGFPPSAASLERSVRMFTEPGSPLTASMYRDIERGGRTEGEHVLGDLLRRGALENKTDSVLRMAYTHVATYEVRRAKLASTGS